MSRDSGPRFLLRQLREVMAEPESAQARLDKVTVLVAKSMKAKVCSVYAVTKDAMLELYATHGLNPLAVHKTQLKVGEGLVGSIASSAEMLNLTDASKHPAFAYRPETGEEIYHSFLGVPILHGGRTIGVLVVQNRTKRHYSEEQAEALETIAMVLAEIIAASDDNGMEGRESVETVSGQMLETGTAIVAGVGIGHVVLHEPRIRVTKLVSDNAAYELKRLETALGELQLSIDGMLKRPDLMHAGEHREVIEAYRMFAHDTGWAAKMREAVNAGLTAEAGVERVLNETRAQLARQSDPYIRERLHDLDDLANRLLRHLTGNAMTAVGKDLPGDAIIFARNIGPAELLDYGPRRLAGLVLEEGSPTSHATIVARALEVPLIGRVENILEVVNEGDPVIIDGSSGEIFLRPSADIKHAYMAKKLLGARRQAQYVKLRGRPAITRDGEKIDLLINAGLLVELPHIKQSGADGIGLLRTEMQFMLASRLPRISEQVDFYRMVLDAAGLKPVTFRALDIGGDKTLPYLRLDREENPAMGWRAMRLSLGRSVLLRMQIRAFLMAAAGRNLKVVFPMIADAAEFLQAREIFAKEAAHLERFGHEPPADIRLGAMVEVPAIIWQLDMLLELADFISVGSNDLHQFMFASDRANPKLAGRYDALSPVMLRALGHIAAKAAEAGIPVTLCGEMAGLPIEAMALIGLGYRSISMTPASAGPVKSMLLKLDVGELRQYMEPLLVSNETSLRAGLEDFALRHNLPL